MKSLKTVSIVMVVAAVLLSACGGAAPEVIEKEVVVEKSVVETVVIEKEIVVEKLVVETVVVEVEKIVEVEAETCVPTISSPPLMNPGIIVVTINPTIPPVQYVKEDGSLAGLRVELGEEFARRMCLEIAWIRMDFAAMIPGLTAGRFDMINTGTFFKEERSAIMEMVPFDLSGMAVSVPMDDPKGIEKVEDLAGLVVGVEAAGLEEKTLREISDELVAQGLAPIDVRTFTDFALSFAALEAGQTDAAMSVDANASFYSVEGRFKLAISGINPTPATFAFNNTELAQAHADILTELYEEGWLTELYERYGLTGSMLMNWKDWSDPNGDPNNVYGWDGEFRVY